MAQADLVLLHPPSVYDFRQQSILYGPISDLIPSSPVFEMYPLGFLTMVAYLDTGVFRSFPFASIDQFNRKSRQGEGRKN